MDLFVVCEYLREHRINGVMQGEIALYFEPIAITNDESFPLAIHATQLPLARSAQILCIMGFAKKAYGRHYLCGLADVSSIFI